MGEKEIFSGNFHVDKVRVWASDINTPDTILRDRFIHILKDNKWDEKCNEKIREVVNSDKLFFTLCFIFHIGFENGTKKRKDMDLDNIIKFYIDAIFQVAYPDRKKAQDRPDYKVNKIIAQKDISEKYNNNESIELKISINDGTLIDCQKA